ncbi:MAG: hypothetical protein FJZ00_05780 [Candidatus Sericytochromatia bacterium]|uniref:Uncharacterized protein n=1 Tax=Candidatus Tanganyikabacteria bacterium TaxID=2961651 RepID=A0A938BMX0_9BACT|nr:hypothetical protein [Candidatus Tanganyikabacteria bacterium]
MRSNNDRDLGTRLLTFTGLPVKVEFRRAAAEGDEEATDEDVLKDQLALYGEAAEEYAKDPKYMKKLMEAQERAAAESAALQLLLPASMR